MARGRFSDEFKAQVLKEIEEVGVVTTVAQKHGISSKTVHNWVHATKYKDQIDETKQIRMLQKQLKDAELENKVLKALLKKTYPHWQSSEQL